MVRDEEGLASLRARGVTKAITIYPEWLALGLKLDKFTAGGENRPRPPPSSYINTRVALHSGKHVGGRPGGFNDGMTAFIETAHAARWGSTIVGKNADPNRGELIFEKHTMVDVEGGAQVKSSVVGISIPDDITTSAILATAVISGWMPPVYVPTPIPWRVVSTAGDLSFLWLFRDLEILDKPIACHGSRGWWAV